MAESKTQKPGRLFLAAGIGLFIGVLFIALYKPDAGVIRDDSGIAKLGGGAVTLPSGLRYEDISVGTGAEPRPGQIVVVHYRGRLTNGTEFDASRNRGVPFKFRFHANPPQVIKGWDMGVDGMKVGGVRRTGARATSGRVGAGRGRGTSGPGVGGLTLGLGKKSRSGGIGCGAANSPSASGARTTAKSGGACSFGSPSSP